MGCGGCGKRREALMAKVSIALDEKRRADDAGEELSAETRTFLEKNRRYIGTVKLNELSVKRKALEDNSEDGPGLLESLDREIKTIREEMGMTGIPPRKRGLVDENGLTGGSTLVYVPGEFKDYIDPPVINPYETNPILTSPLGPRCRRAIRRNERMARRDLKKSILDGDTEKIKNMSDNYAKQMVDVYLLNKKEEIEKASLIVEAKK